MGDDLGAASVAADDRRRQEHHPRILHSAVGEARRKNQEIKSLPLVLPKEGLPHADHVFHSSELRRRQFDNLRRSLRIDDRPRPNLTVADIPGGKGEEVGRDGLPHLEFLDGSACSAPELVGEAGWCLPAAGLAAGDSGSGHYSGEFGGDVEESGVLDTSRGGVLAREDGAGVDGLALGVDERRELSGGLVRGKPLESGGGRGSGEGDKEGGEGGEV